MFVCLFPESSLTTFALGSHNDWSHRIGQDVSIEDLGYITLQSFLHSTRETDPCKTLWTAGKSIKTRRNAVSSTSLENPLPGEFLNNSWETIWHTLCKLGRCPGVFLVAMIDKGRTVLCSRPEWFYVRSRSVIVICRIIVFLDCRCPAA